MPSLPGWADVTRGRGRVGSGGTDAGSDAGLMKAVRYLSDKFLVWRSGYSNHSRLVVHCFCC